MRSGKKYPRIEVPQDGRVAQLGEHLLCKQGVTGSIPVTSTNHLPANQLLTNLAFVRLP